MNGFVLLHPKYDSTPSFSSSVKDDKSKIELDDVSWERQMSETTVSSNKRFLSPYKYFIPPPPNSSAFSVASTIPTIVMTKELSLTPFKFA